MGNSVLKEFLPVPFEWSVVPIEKATVISQVTGQIKLFTNVFQPILKYPIYVGDGLTTCRAAAAGSSAIMESRRSWLPITLSTSRFEIGFQLGGSMSNTQPRCRIGIGTLGLVHELGCGLLERALRGLIPSLSRMKDSSPV
jgi:hypothetical protein